MHNLTILIGDGSTWTFLFKEPSDADKAGKAIAKSRASARTVTALETDIQIEDDFGAKATIDVLKVSAWQISDLAKALEGQATVGLLQARAQGRLQARAQQDPELMFLHGAAVVPPNGKIIRPG
jgi:hypothetical protein